ncbi:MAG: hypothetical protein ACLRHW_16655 [Coprobacillus cateniformis]
MKKSLFRLNDILELGILYFICFSSNLVFDYIESISFESYVLKVFLKNILAYRVMLSLFLTIIVVVYHYQFIHKTKKKYIVEYLLEILCQM